jgi:hypothetical protein
MPDYSPMCGIGTRKTRRTQKIFSAFSVYISVPNNYGLRMNSHELLNVQTICPDWLRPRKPSRPS